MTVAQLKNRYNTLKTKFKSGEISAEDAKEKAIILLADAMDLEKVVEADSEDAFKLAKITKILEQELKVETVNL